jgi:predicted permease
MTHWIRELHLAVRALARSPGFTVVAVVTLAVGIGANTAIFSVVDGVLVRALPYPDPDRLVEIDHLRLDSGEEMTVSPGNYYDWAAAAESFEALAAYDWVSTTLTGAGPARQVQGVQTAGSLFDVLDVPAARGRTYTAAADTPAGEAIAVLSSAFARELFGDDDPLGRTITLDGESFAVIGVMPSGFGFPDPTASFWAPARWGEEFRSNRTEYFMRSIGRLAPGTTVAAAREELRTIMERLRAEYPEANGQLTATVTPLKDEIVADARGLLGILMGAVGAVLLVACVNISNLMLVRTNDRRREVAMRKALGASRWQVLRHVGTEGLALGLVGGLLGLALGAVLLDALLALFPGDLPRAESIRIDGRVFVFTLTTSLLATLLATLVPALQAASGAPADRLRGWRSGGERWARGLVIAEVLLAVVLVSGATLLVRSLAQLRAEDPGFDATGLLAVDVDVPGSYDLGRRAAFYRSIAERIEALPGVDAASYATVLPTEGGGSAAWINFMDRPAPEGEPPFADYRVVGTGFTDVMAIPLRRGRLPRPEVSMSGPAEVVIDEVLAERFWPDVDPLGREITLGPDGGWIPPARIVGIVGATKGAALGGSPPGLVYLPHGLAPWWTGMTLVVRTAGDPTTLVSGIRRHVAALDPDVPVLGVESVSERVRRSIAAERSVTTLLSLSALLALGLAAVGLFGVLSYAVSRRTRELGIRVALGAGPGGVRRRVLMQGASLVIAGLVPGLLLAMAGSRLLEGWLFNVPRLDPVAYGAAAAVLLAVGLAAAWLPAARATRVDPAEALRAD